MCVYTFVAFFAFRKKEDRGEFGKDIRRIGIRDDESEV
jgi:hypothetical protein